MKIAWIAFGSVQLRDGVIDSGLASLRYRLLIPARALRAMGHASDIVTVTGGEEAGALAARIDADVLVVTKLVPGSARYTEKTAILQHLMALARRSGGARTVVDVCDDHFRHEYFRELAASADLVTVPTAAMADAVRAATGKDSAVIGDPYEGAAGEARLELSRLACGEALRLLWFGYPNNQPALLDCLPGLLGAVSVPLELEVVSRPGSAAQLCGQIAREHPGRVAVRFTAWSPQSMAAAFAACDAVILPSVAGDPQKRVKSANRLIESIRAGRFVLAHPLPSYREFAQHAWVGENLGEGLDWLLANPGAALQRLRAGQDYVAARYSPEAIAAGWHAALSPLAARG